MLNAKLEFVFQANAYSTSAEFLITATSMNVTNLGICLSTFRQCVVSTYYTLDVATVTEQFSAVFFFDTEAVTNRSFNTQWFSYIVCNSTSYFVYSFRICKYAVCKLCTFSVLVSNTSKPRLCIVTNLSYDLMTVHVFNFTRSIGFSRYTVSVTTSYVSKETCIFVVQTQRVYCFVIC